MTPDFAQLPQHSRLQVEGFARGLRSRGEPVRVRLKGSGTAGAWTEEDSELPAELRISVQRRRGGWERLAQRLAQQRLGSLDKNQRHE
jgi:hypothetical protein